MLRYDSAERLRATSVDRDGSDVVYGRTARGRDGRRWLQYWLFYVDNPQDRGILRTGRHEGDWEMVQVGLGRAGRPELVTAAQHSWGESCSWRRVRHQGSAPVVFPAHASHATYLRPGDVDRPIGDPTDEADGRGRRTRPAVRRISARSPAWMRSSERWGSSRAGIVPGEQSSPRGPAFQGVSWDDPSAFDRAARRCGTGPPPRTWLTVVPVAALALLLASAVLMLRRTRIARR